MTQEEIVQLIFEKVEVAEKKWTQANNTGDKDEQQYYFGHIVALKVILYELEQKEQA